VICVKPTYVVFAAGSGSRLWPSTEEQQKCLLHVLGRPLLEWTFEEMGEAAGKIVFVVGEKKENIIKRFGKYPHVSFVEQKERRGTGHALLQAEQAVEGDFVTIMGDDFAEPSFFKLIAETVAAKKYAAFGKKVDDRRRFGVLFEKNGLLTNLIEKPPEPGPGLANTNVFYLPKEFFSYLHKLSLSPRGEYELTDAVKEFAKNHDLAVKEYGGYWNGLTYYWNYLDVNKYALQHMLQEKTLGEVEKKVSIDGKMFLGENSVIKSGTRVEGNAYIGADCVIGPNAFIRGGTVIEDDCKIVNSEVKASVLMHETHAQHFSYIGDSVVCEKVNFGAGSKVANLRFDDENIKVDVNGKLVDSGRRKLGAAIGAHTKIGLNAAINCGVLIGRNCRIHPNTFVKRNLPNDTVFNGE